MPSTPADDAAPVAARDALVGTGLQQAMAPFTYRNFSLYWISGFLSNIGRWIQDLVIPYVLYDLTRSGSVVGLAAFLRFAPFVLAGPVAGTIADRFDRRTVLVVAQTALAVVAVLLWAAWGLGADVATLMVLAAVIGLLHALSTPTWQAFIPELTPRELLLGAITLSSAQANAAKALGPAAAGAILATAGVGWAFLSAAVAFGAVSLVLMTIHVPRRVRRIDRRGSVANFLATARHVAAQPELASCVGVMCAAAFLGMPVLQLTPVFATDVLEVGPVGFGLLAGSLGLGGAASAPILGGWTQQLPRGPLISASLLGYGVALLAFAQARSLLVAVAAMLCVGVGFLFTTSTVTSTMQLAVADELQGRVVAVFGTAFAMAYPLGSLVQGWLVDRIGARLTVTGAAVLMIGTAVWLLWNRRIQSRLSTVTTAPGPTST